MPPYCVSSTASRPGQGRPRRLERLSVPRNFIEETVDALLPRLGIDQGASCAEGLGDELHRDVSRDADGAEAGHDLPQGINSSHAARDAAAADQSEWLLVPRLERHIKQILQRPRETEVVLRGHDDKAVGRVHLLDERLQVRRVGVGDILCAGTEVPKLVLSRIDEDRFDTGAGLQPRQNIAGQMFGLPPVAFGAKDDGNEEGHAGP